VVLEPAKHPVELGRNGLGIAERVASLRDANRTGLACPA
jgi:hypothetical protein